MLVSRESDSNGVLQVLTDDGWTSICDDYWSQDASDVACRQLGYEYVVYELTSPYLFLHANDCYDIHTFS